MAIDCWATLSEARAASPALIKEVDPELERLIAEEEEMERRLRGSHEAPHFRKEVD